MNKISRRSFLEAGSASAFSLLLRRRSLPSAAKAASFVESLWSGALMPTSARVNARIAHESNSVRLLVSVNPDLSNPIRSGPFIATTATNNRMVSIPVAGLNPGTPYYYGIESASLVDDTNRGRFRTPVYGPQSFSFALGSCADTGSEHAVFDTIRSLNPLFFLHTGDMHYENIGVNDVTLFRGAYDTVLASATQSALYRQVPIAYMWDDHDFGPNDSDGTSASRPAARATYQEYVPHYPLAAGSGDVPIYQSFTIGRVRFILTDLRSERTPKIATDDGDKTMMGGSQKAWFKAQLLAANGRQAIVWVSSMPWIGAPAAGADYWAGYATERQEIANFISDNGISGLVVLSGDAHMVALDDGTNSDYTSNGGASFPVFHAAALDRTGSTKGGPYSHGSYPGGGQFGLVTVTDDGGGSLTITLSGRDSANKTIVEASFDLLYDVHLPLIVKG
jgi:alkaline phosphatase D